MSEAAMITPHGEAALQALLAAFRDPAATPVRRAAVSVLLARAGACPDCAARAFEAMRPMLTELTDAMQHDALTRATDPGAWVTEVQEEVRKVTESILLPARQAAPS